MSEIANRPAQLVQIGTDEQDAPARRKVIGLLEHMPNILDAARKFAPSDTFRVVLSDKNAHLFHMAPDGTWNTVLREGGGRIQEHGHLVQSGVDVLTAVPNIVLAVSMAAIANKLAAVEAKLDHLGHIVTSIQEGRLQGALDALSTARLISFDGERRRGMLTACSTIQIELIATIGLLKAHIAAMPKEKTGRFDGLFGTGFGKATRAFDIVREDLRAIGLAAGTLLQAFADLDEPAAARNALDRVAAALRGAGLTEAIQKARLLPTAPDLPAPETGLISLSSAMTAIDTQLLSHGAMDELALSIDLQPSELCRV